METIWQLIKYDLMNILFSFEIPNYEVKNSQKIVLEIFSQINISRNLIFQWVSVYIPSHSARLFYVR